MSTNDPHLAEMTVALPEDSALTEEMKEAAGLNEPEPTEEMEEITAVEEVGETYVPSPEQTSNLPPEEMTAVAPINPAGNADTAIAIAAMQEQIASLQGELSAVREQTVQPVKNAQETPGGYPRQYYKRGKFGVEAGWIEVAGGGSTPKGNRNVGQYLTYTGRKGFKALTAYGVVDVASAFYGKPPGSQYIPMLQRGGAKEFPPSQVLAYKWDVKPPIPGLKFPQVEAVKEKVRIFECPEDCGFSLHFLIDDRTSSATCFRHLRTDKGDGTHGYPRPEASMLLKSMGIVIQLGEFAVEAERERAEQLLTPAPVGLPPRDN